MGLLLYLNGLQEKLINKDGSMNTFLKIFVVTLLFCACDSRNTSELVIETDNDKVVYKVETASSLEELQTGLMNRDYLPKNGGMIFDLSPFMTQNTSMWMKDTKIPLDMLFLTKEGFVFWIKQYAKPYSEESITAPFPAYAVLELNAGQVAKHKIKIGHFVKHAIFNKPAQEPASGISFDESANTDEQLNASEESVTQAENTEVSREGTEVSAEGTEVSSESTDVSAETHTSEEVSSEEISSEEVNATEGVNATSPSSENVAQSEAK